MVQRGQTDMLGLSSNRSHSRIRIREETGGHPQQNWFKQKTAVYGSETDGRGNGFQLSLIRRQRFEPQMPFLTHPCTGTGGPTQTWGSGLQWMKLITGIES